MRSSQLLGKISIGTISDFVPMVFNKLSSKFHALAIKMHNSRFSLAVKIQTIGHILTSCCFLFAVAICMLLAYTRASLVVRHYIIFRSSEILFERKCSMFDFGWQLFGRE